MCKGTQIQEGLTLILEQMAVVNTMQYMIRNLLIVLVIFLSI